MATNTVITEALKAIGIAELKEKQKEAVERLDTLAVLPTGYVII